MSLGNFIKSARNIMRQDPGINGDAQRLEQLVWMLFLKIYDTKESDWELIEDNFHSILPEELRWRNWADTQKKDGLRGDDLMRFVNEKLFQGLKNLEIPLGTPRRQSIIKDVFADLNNYMKDGQLFFQLLQVVNETDFSDQKEVHTFGAIYETLLRELQSAGSAGEFYTPRALTDFMAQHVDLKLGDTVADFACGTGGFLNSARRYLSQQVKTSEDQETLSKSFQGFEKKPLPYLLCVTNLLLNGVEDADIQHKNSLAKDVAALTPKDLRDVILMNPPYGGSELVDIQNNFPADLASSETADLFMILIMKSLKENGRAAVILPDGFLFGTGNKTELKKELLTKFNLHTVIRLPSSIFAPYTSIATNILFFDKNSVPSEQEVEDWVTEEVKEKDENEKPVTKKVKVKKTVKKMMRTRETWFYRFDKPNGKNFSKTNPIKLSDLKPVADWWQNREAIIEDDFTKSRKFTPTELSKLDYNFDQCSYPHEKEEILPPLELVSRYKEERSLLEKRIDSVLDSILTLTGDRHEC